MIVDACAVGHRAKGVDHRYALERLGVIGCSALADEPGGTSEESSPSDVKTCRVSAAALRH